jgi:hypothetical protein
MNMFIVKLKTKDSLHVSYCNRVFIVSEQDLHIINSLDNLIMSEKEAKAVALDIMINRPNGIDLEFISVAEVVNRDSLRPFRVLFYKEF